MIKAIIIDDEEHCIDRLLNLLVKHFAGEVLVTGCYRDIDSGVEAIKESDPDLLFLDINMGQTTGFDLLQHFTPDYPFQVVFTTAHDTFALQAIEASAVHYLLKPIDLDDLRESVRRVTVRMGSDNVRIPPENQPRQSKKMMVSTAQGNEFLTIADIIRCQSHINTTTIYLKKRPPVKVAKTLREFEAILSLYHFFRVHNSHLVNLDYVESFNRAKNMLLLEDGSEIEVSGRRKDEFLKKFSKP